MMNEEIKWITVWILLNSLMAGLSLTYLYLNHELHIYGTMITIPFLLSIVLSYSICKYNQIKFVNKRTIVIKILND